MRTAMRGFAGWMLVAVAVPLVGAACGGSNSGAPGSGGPGDAGVGDGAVEGSPPEDASPQRDATGSDVASPHDAASEHVVEAGPFVPAAHPGWPQLPANGGVVLHPMKLVTVVTAGDPLASTYFGFGDALIASAWWQAIGKDYGLGTPSASVHVTGPAITVDPGSAAMQSYIASAVASTPAAAADGQTMYMLYLPSGIDILDDASNMPNVSCQFYGGYHSRYDTSGDAWGVGQHCPVAGTGLTDTEWMTIVGSHEIAEAATDPVPGSGYTLVVTPDTQQPWTQSPWVAALYGEVGDMCVGTKLVEGGYTYQRIWSNTAAATGFDPCVPAYSQVAYVNTSAPKGWYTVTAGGSVQVPLTGFSDRSTTDWLLDAQVWSSSAPGFAATVASPTSITYDAGTYATTNNGKASTMTITAQATLASGSWVTFVVYSVPSTPGGDPYHMWFVGAYVP